MSDKILKALMQLFAIIGKYETEIGAARRKMEEQFLKQTLNEDQAREYLKIYDDFISAYNRNEPDSEKKRKKNAVRAVKVLLICHQINEGLTQRQKIVVIAKLIEYTFVSDDVDEQEREFINTVYQSFHISKDEFRLIFNFITQKEPDDNENLLILSENNNHRLNKTKFLHIHHLQGELRVIRVKSADVFFVKYYGGMEITLNGISISDSMIQLLNSGSSIKGAMVHSIYYSDILSCFLNDLIPNPISYKVNNIDYFFPDGKRGLHPLTFEEHSGKLLGIMGGSGAGKSTLLNILNGSAEPSHGNITINGIDLHQSPEQLDGIIGFISQDDLLIEDLTVFQNLFFNAELCFAGLSKEELTRKVDKTLKDLGLYEVKNLKVGSPLDKMISGGQRKRLNIALELIREPAVLFVDEPTSGLSSRDSEIIIDLLKTMALKGKIVFVVIHQPSSDIFKVFDRLLVLDKGGYPIYLGNPVESVTYFKNAVNYINANESQCLLCGNVNPEQVFNIIETCVLDENGVLTKDRKISPREWNKRFIDNLTSDKPAENIIEPLPEVDLQRPSLFKQFRVFVKRDVLAKLNNFQYLIINAVEAPLLAFILSFLTRYQKEGQDYTFYDNKNLVAYVFMSVIVALFLGLTVSAEEIFKDRKIRKREAFLNLSKGAYLLSKVFILFFISAIQTFLFVMIGNSIIGFEEMHFQYWLMLFTVSIFANVLGLNISASFKSAVTIYIVIPFLIIPQLLLSGLLVKFNELNPLMASKSVVPVSGEIMATRWAFEGLMVNQFVNNRYEKNIYWLEKEKINAAYRKGLWHNKMTELLAEYEKGNKVETATVLKNELEKLGFRDVTRGNELDKAKAKKILEEQKKLNNAKYAHAVKKLDNYFADKLSNEGNKLAFEKLKETSHNEKIGELVRNANAMDGGIFVERNQLFPSENSIYFIPESGRQIRAHFYAPKKLLWNHYYDTYWVNIGVIILMTLFLLVFLYFDALALLLKVTKRLNRKLGKYSFRKTYPQ